LPGASTGLGLILLDESIEQDRQRFSPEDRLTRQDSGGAFRLKTS